MSSASTPRQAVLVLGIARSGTSALSGALAAMGIDFGRGLKPPDRQNPRGNFEHFELSRLNQQALAHFGLDWSSGRPLPAGWLDAAAMAPLRARIEAILARDFDAALAGIKDPRLVALWPLYRQALTAAGCETTFVTIERAAGEVAQSIRASGYLHGPETPGRLAALHRFYMDELDRLVATEGALRIRHAALMRDPAATLADLAGRLPFGKAGVSADIDAGAATIDRALHRQRG
ncbi:hypothetical protein [uncultured Parvibaculum sp.]|uniref:hypothetical protein n=1 Tax=uncultured Parvibaculum sp. TaxID=291828 RepID=UPI0030D72776|tara:strand:+ start:2302 stop:3003 length:702 start_codon:yes stop_codon:yes gene_type:complete